MPRKIFQRARSTRALSQVYVRSPFGPITLPNLLSTSLISPTRCPLAAPLRISSNTAEAVAVFPCPANETTKYSSSSSWLGRIAGRGKCMSAQSNGQHESIRASQRHHDAHRLERYNQNGVTKKHSKAAGRQRIKERWFDAGTAAFERVFPGARAKR